MQYYKRIKDLREDNDLFQKDIADILHIGKNTYINYEQGKREPPFEVIIKLAEYYKVSIDYIAGKKERNSDTLNAEELELLKNYNQLSEKQKGEIEYHIKQLLESAADSKENVG